MTVNVGNYRELLSTTLPRGGGGGKAPKREALYDIKILSNYTIIGLILKIIIKNEKKLA